jgi:membrane protein
VTQRSPFTWWDWTRIVYQSANELLNFHGGMVAASVAFYAFFSIAPALSASIAAWALMADPQFFADQVSQAVSGLPPDAAQLVSQQAWRLAVQAQSGAGPTAVLRFLLALYSANQATKAMIEGLNIIHRREERRGFFRLNLTSLALTLLLVLGAAAALGVIVILPNVFTLLGLKWETSWLIAMLRWPLLLAGVMLALAALYQVGPSPDWRSRRPRVGLGVAASAALWILASMVFSFYVSSFAGYSATYGSFSAIIVLMTWLWLSAFVMLFGAQLNVEAERALSAHAGKAQPARRRLRTS